MNRANGRGVRANQSMRQIKTIRKRTEPAFIEPMLRMNLEQEFVIGGYIPGARGFGALLVGVYETRELVFVAKEIVMVLLNLFTHRTKSAAGRACNPSLLTIWTSLRM